MTTSLHRDAFLQRLLHERDKFELLLNRIGFSRRMTMKGVVGTWSIKDIIAQVWAYEQHAADRLSELAQNEPYTPAQTYPALDTFCNEFGYPDFGAPLLSAEEAQGWVYEHYKNVALEEIVVQELQAFNSIVALLEKLPNETLQRHDVLTQVAEHTYLRYRSHIRDIKVWLTTNAMNLKE